MIHSRIAIIAAGVCSLTTLAATQESRPGMPWQRSLDDALALVESTGKPLLICANMDGEVASESLARDRYHDPEFIAIANGFICVLASPNRHGERDYDDRGRRVPDPKFGRVTSYEHIVIEPQLFERYFNGRRVAPRHVGVSPGGEILFDVFLSSSLSEVDTVLREHGNPGSTPRATTEDELLNSPDAGDRERLEAKFFAADTETQQRLASVALSADRQTQHPEIIRLALRSHAAANAAARGAARKLNAIPSDLWTEVLAALGHDPDHMALALSSLGDIAKGDDETLAKRANHLHRVFGALNADSKVVAREAWLPALKTEARPEPPLSENELIELDERLNELEQRASRDADQDTLVALAETTMRFARTRMLQGNDPRFLFEDARSAAVRAIDASGPKTGRARGYVAWVSYLLSEPTAGDAAAQALPDLTGEATTPLAVVVLEAFAKARTQQLYSALGPDGEWSEEWVSDINAAYGVLTRHPLGTEQHAISYIDFLDAVEAWGLSEDVARRSSWRFPGSVELHSRLRSMALTRAGAAALEAVYDFADPNGDAPPEWNWFAGLGYLTAAEQRVRDEQPERALSGYSSSENSFELARLQNPEYAPSSQHYICLALAGAARLQIDRNNLAAATASIRKALTTSPGAALQKDGLGHSPADTAALLLRRLESEKKNEEGTALRQLLDELGIKSE